MNLHPLALGLRVIAGTAWYVKGLSCGDLLLNYFPLKVAVSVSNDSVN